MIRVEFWKNVKKTDKWTQVLTYNEVDFVEALRAGSSTIRGKRGYKILIYDADNTKLATIK